MSSPVLCDWCQTTVFDKHLLAVIGRDRDSMYMDQSPFSVMIDPVAYFGNRNALAGFQRSFRRNNELLLQNAARWCIFCMLLRNLRGGLRDDFEFTITVNDPWKWSTVTVAAHDDEITNRTGYLRVYKTVSPNKVALSGSTFNNARVAEQNVDICPANNDLLQHDSSLPRQLVRDCGALRALIDDCTANHSNCKPREGLGSPSLLLELSGTSVSPAVRLIKTSEIKVVPIRYVCLSYCWGGIQPNMTTTSRLDSYLAGIDTTEISETILDAIRVSLAMGYQYLWVDALCIVQDCEPDKIVELGKMASIYSGAILTICVMSAKSATEGFLRQAYPNYSDDKSIRTWHADIRDDISQLVTGSLEIRSDFSNDDIFDSPILKEAGPSKRRFLVHALSYFLLMVRSLHCDAPRIPSNRTVVGSQRTPKLW
ncbi:hypothetical protein CBS133816_5579 [Aspergillus niger]|nr:hypothetical protein CBS133816_5579 [Aspergillus niger]